MGRLSGQSPKGSGDQAKILIIPVLSDKIAFKQACLVLHQIENAGDGHSFMILSEDGRELASNDNCSKKL